MARATSSSRCAAKEAELGGLRRVTALPVCHTALGLSGRLAVPRCRVTQGLNTRLVYKTTTPVTDSHNTKDNFW